MKHRIRRFSVHQTALVVAVAQALVSLLFIPFFLFVTLLDPNTGWAGAWIAFVMPVFALIMGYISAALWTFFYNLIATMVGGIEFELEPVGGAGPASAPPM